MQVEHLGLPLGFGLRSWFLLSNNVFPIGSQPDYSSYAKECIREWVMYKYQVIFLVFILDLNCQKKPAASYVEKLQETCSAYPILILCKIEKFSGTVSCSYHLNHTKLRTRKHLKTKLCDHFFLSCWII